MQITNRQHIDYFKVFKLFDIKKLQKQGQVKIVQDKTFGRKILSVQGNVSTQNYIIFDSNDVAKSQPNLSFAQRYLYIIGWMEVGKNFFFQIELLLNSRIYKILFSTVYKQSKLTTQGNFQVPLSELKSAKWTILVIDLYQLCRKFCDFEQMRLSFKLSKVQIRANSKVKNIYLSDNLYDPYTFPKDMELPLKKDQDYYSKFDYLIINEKQIPQLKTKQGSLKNIDSLLANEKKIPQVKLKQKQYEKEKEEKQELQLAIQKSIKIPKVQSKIKKMKIQKQESMQNKFQEFYEDQNSMPIRNIEPKPQITINCKLVGIEGRSLIHQGIIALEAFIIYPTIFAVHKPIQCMSLHQQFAHILAVGYVDGSICIWDIVRHKSLSYIKTELSQIKSIHIRGSGETQKIFMVGNDKIKRETILIINRSDVLFRQISNYSIKNFLICTPSKNENQEVIVSFGFENIRLWKLNSSNNIITGVGLYLGKMNRKVTYSHACKLTEDIILVIDNHGYLTRISTYQQRVQEVKKMSENGLDFIINIKEMNTILICESGGNIKLLSYELQVLEQFQFGNRVRELSYTYNNNNGQVMLKIDHFNNCTANYNIQLSQYDYKSRQHTQPVVCLGYNHQLSKVVTVSLDNTIRIWSMLSSCDEANGVGRKSTNKPNRQLKQYQMECMIKEEYQFLISNGEQILTLALDNGVYAFVGFKGGIVRKIDLLKYEIIEQRTFNFKSDLHVDQLLRTQFYIKSLQVSKNNKNLLICVSETHKNKRINNYVVLSDCNLNILYKYNAPLNYDYDHDNNEVLAGFSDTHKKIYICWVYGSIKKLQIFSLTDSLDKICVQFYIECDPLEIRLADNRVFVTGKTKNNKSVGNSRTFCAVYEVYCEDNGELLRDIKTDITNNYVEERKKTEANCKKQRNRHRISFPIMVHSNSKQQLELQTLQTSPMMVETKECIDMPEAVENITICESKSDGTDMSGLIICSGCNSYALYAVAYSIKNAGQLHENINSNVDADDSYQNYSKFKQYNKRLNMIERDDQRERQDQEQQLECVQNKLIQFDGKSFNISSLQSRQINHKSNKSNAHPRMMSQKSINSHHLLSNMIQQESERDNYVVAKPTLLNPLYQKQEQNYEQCIQYEDSYKKPSSEFLCESQNTNENTKSIEYNHQGIQIMYGWHNRYTYNEKTIDQCRRLIWNPALQTALFISHRNLILHYFKQPIHQKIIRLPLYPNFILSIGNNKKYIAVALGNQIRLFSEELVFLRTFSTFGSDAISLCISNCEGYIVVLSLDIKKNKSYIQVLDILTCNTLCSTYLRMVNQSTRIITNPFTHPLQFLLFSSAQAHFYRLTSILSLQTQELEDLPKIMNNKGLGEILCGNYIKLQEQELILFGMSDGSIVIVDGRANSIMMVCRNITKYGIVDIMVQQYEINNQNTQEYAGVVILVTQSNIIHKYNLKQMRLQDIIQVFNRTVNETNPQQIALLTTDSEITLFSKVQKLSSESYGMLLITKLGVLWLVDVLDNQTIKILTVHSNVVSPNIHTPDSKIISKCIVSSEFTKNMSFSDIKIITGSFDGTLKETSFFNLEQTIQVYKPRRIVNDFQIANGMIIVAFGMEIFFYLIQQHQNQNQWKFIGSINIADTQRNIFSDKSSINLSNESIKIKNIAFSDNYIVLTSKSILLIYHEKNLSIQTGKLKLEVKQICNSLEDAIDLQVLGYNQILVREKSKVNVWLRKDKRGELPLKQLSKVDQVTYYISDVYHIEASYANFICNSFAASIKKDKLNQKQLIICLKSLPIIQIRDIEQHSIIRQIQIGVSSIVRALKITIDGNYMIGDQQGIVWLIKQNGLTLNKVKVFDGEVSGLIEIENCGKYGSNAIVYGDNVAFIHI